MFFVTVQFQIFDHISHLWIILYFNLGKDEHSLKSDKNIIICSGDIACVIYNYLIVFTDQISLQFIMYADHSTYF